MAGLETFSFVVFVIMQRMLLEVRRVHAEDDLCIELHEGNKQQESRGHNQLHMSRAFFGPRHENCARKVHFVVQPLAPFVAFVLRVFFHGSRSVKLQYQAHKVLCLT